MDYFDGSTPLSEDEIKTRVVEAMQDDFEIHTEVQGRHPLAPNPIRIDFMVYPRAHIIQLGFDPCWVGIEAKAVTPQRPSDRGRKVRLIWQAICYAQSAFDLPGHEPIRPGFVLVAVDRQTEAHRKWSTDEHWAEWRTALHLGSFARVGEFSCGGHHGWEITFTGGPYFTRVTGRSRINPFAYKTVGSI